MKYTQNPLSIKGRYRLYALEVIKGLYELGRTGWIDRGVKNPETVGEHTDELISMAKRLFPNISGLIRMIKIHDWLEYDKKVGDRRTDKYCPIDHRYTREEKKAAEYGAMEKICLKLGPYGKSIFKLWLEYEEGKTERAQIAFQLDKLQVDLKAIKYQMAGESVVAMEFIELNRDKITIPVLKEMLEKAEEMLQKYLTKKD